MSDLSDTVLHAVRLHIAERRADIAAKFPKRLKRKDYFGLCGMHQEIEMVAVAVQEAVRKANAAEQADPVDDNEGGYT
jgi:hypothetical protein